MSGNEKLTLPDLPSSIGKFDCFEIQKVYFQKPVQRSSVLELEKNKTSSSEESPRKDNSNIGKQGR
jgi:hypothetical protein